MKTKQWERTDRIPDNIREQFRKQFDRIINSVELSLNENGQLTDLEGKLVEATPVGQPLTFGKQYAMWTRGSTVQTDLSQTIRGLMPLYDEANAYRIMDTSKQCYSFIYNICKATVQLYRIEGLKIKTFEDRVKEIDMFGGCKSEEELKRYVENGFRKDDKK